MTAPTSRMPALFLGHGSPINATERNRYTDAWGGLSASLPRPKAILAVSAHWYARRTAVTAMERPRTIHDFSGFPDALYDIQYPAPGDTDLAQHVFDLLAPIDVALDKSWGLDHGTWSVLAQMYPLADVPVVQLRIDAGQPPEFHYQLAARLAPLRDQSAWTQPDRTPLRLGEPRAPGLLAAPNRLDRRSPTRKSAAPFC